MPYIYQADIYCDSCGRDIASRLTEPETPYDSNDYPHYVATHGETDTPQHCGSGPDCLEGVEDDDGTKFGAPLTEGLTDYGIGYVLDALHECMDDGGRPSQVLRGWRVLLYDYPDVDPDRELDVWDGYVSGWDAAMLYVGTRLAGGNGI